MAFFRNTRLIEGRANCLKVNFIQSHLGKLDPTEDYLYDPLCRFEDIMNKATEQLVKDIRAQLSFPTNANDCTDFEYDFQEGEILNEVSKILSEQKITTLHRITEVRLMRVLTYVYGLNDKDRIKLSRHEQLAEFLFQRELISDKSFNDYIELTLISNSIKHEGDINNKLVEKFPNPWKQAEGFTRANIEEAYSRLKPKVRDLTVQIFENIISSLTTLPA